MNTTIKYILSFAAGAGIGSVVTWKLLKTKYEQFAQEQIDSVKETYGRRGLRANIDVLDEASDLDPDVVKDITKPFVNEESDVSVADYAKQLNELGYTRYSDISKKEDEKEEKTEPMKVDKPYVIPPDDFGEFDDYETISLICFADQVVTDEDYEIIEDVDDIVGLDSLNHFGVYEDDSVHVRNDARKCDYEILADPRNYSDIC